MALVGGKTGQWPSIEHIKNDSSLTNFIESEFDQEKANQFISEAQAQSSEIISGKTFLLDDSIDRTINGLMDLFFDETVEVEVQLDDLIGQ